MSKVHVGMVKTKNRKSVIHTGMLRVLEPTMEKGKTMAECMMFPNDWEKFLEDYSFCDSEKVYTNGSELIPTFRVEQMVEHYFATDNNDGCKRIEELEAQLAEREKVVIQLRKQWQDAEMHICTMCGHFDHKTDGNIVYGNQTCGEICGYPFCKEKFTPWIPVSERLPGEYKAVIVWTEYHEIGEAQYTGKHFQWIDDEGYYDYAKVTHWMPLPEPPKEEKNNG